MQGGPFLGKNTHLFIGRAGRELESFQGHLSQFPAAVLVTQCPGMIKGIVGTTLSESLGAPPERECYGEECQEYLRT